MLSFFTKKIFLVDQLANFVDIHNHILPGIDDGAKKLEESIALIKRFQEFGIQKFIATPHIMGELYPNTPRTINDALLLLKDALITEKMQNVSVEAGAEHMIDDMYESLLEKEQIMPLRNDYMLVEMSYLYPSINFEEAIQKTCSKQYYPILAHPERYNYLHSKNHLLSQYKRDGVFMQLNLLSLSDYYGSKVYKKAQNLLENNLIDFVATDVHNMHQLNSLSEITISKKTLQLITPLINNTIETFY